MEISMVFLKYRKKLSLMVISFESMAKYVSMPGNFYGIRIGKSYY